MFTSVRNRSASGLRTPSGSAASGASRGSARTLSPRLGVTNSPAASMRGTPSPPYSASARTPTSWKNAVDAERTVVAPPATACRADATVATCTCASISPGSTNAPSTSMTLPRPSGRAPRPTRRTTPAAEHHRHVLRDAPEPGSSSRAPVSSAAAPSGACLAVPVVAVPVTAAPAPAAAARGPSSAAAPATPPFPRVRRAA